MSRNQFCDHFWRRNQLCRSFRLLGLLGLLGLRVFAVLLLAFAAAVASADSLAADVRVESPPYTDLPTTRSDASLHRVRFFDSGAGVAVGDHGAVWWTADGGTTWSAGNSGLACRIDDVVWTGPSNLVAVGGAYDRITCTSRGVVITSRDGGRTWNRGDDGELPRLRTIELRTIEATGGGVLVARGDWADASLANRFDSRDGGRTWNAGGQPESADVETNPTDVADLLSWVGATSSAVTIRDACSVASNTPDQIHRLCAVGDHGVILTSDDRGKTWIARLGEQRRTAVLVVARDPASVAWSIVGNETMEERNRVAILVQSADDQGMDTAAQVAAMVGASGLDTIGDRGPVDETAMQWLMVTRPVALLLDEELPQTTRDAFFRAATSVGVGRIASYNTSGKGPVTLHRDALLPQTGILASDVQSDAMHWIAPLKTEARSTSIRYLYDAASSRRTGESITSGMTMHIGRKRTHSPGTTSRRQLQVVQARINQSARVDQLLRSARSPSQLAKAIDAMLDQTDRPDQFRLAWSIFGRTVSMTSIPIEYQTTVLDRITARFKDETAGQYAKLYRDAVGRSAEWTSAEWKRIDAGLTPASFLTESAALRSVAVSPFQSEVQTASVSPNGAVASASENVDVAFGKVRQASAIAPFLVPKPELIGGPSPAVAPEPLPIDLAWEFHPLVLLAMEASERSTLDANAYQTLDLPRSHSATLKRLSETKRHPWSPLVRDSGVQTLYANRAETPPHLDGRLSDACWKVSNVTEHTGVPLRIAHDADYVYVAVVCDADSLSADPMSATSTTHALRQG